MKILLRQLIVAGFACLAVVPAIAENKLVDEPADVGVSVLQVIDIIAQNPSDAFRFDPRFLVVEKGAVIQFLGSSGRHTVSAIKPMIPEGARGFEIRGKPELNFQFDVEGVYGIRCRVHGRHGMVMLLVVGDPSSNLAAAKAYVSKLPEAEAAQFEKLFEELE